MEVSTALNLTAVDTRMDNTSALKAPDLGHQHVVRHTRQVCQHIFPVTPVSRCGADGTNHQFVR